MDRTRLRARAGAGDAGAKRALDITARTSFMLSGAQLGITVTGLLVGYAAEPMIGGGVGQLPDSVAADATVAELVELMAAGHSRYPSTPWICPSRPASTRSPRHGGS